MNTDLSQFQVQSPDLTSNADGSSLGYTSPTGEWSMVPPSATSTSTTPPATGGKTNVWDAVTTLFGSAGQIFGKPQNQLPVGYGYPATPYYGTNPNAMSMGAVVGLSIAGLALVGTVIYFATKK